MNLKNAVDKELKCQGGEGGVSNQGTLYQSLLHSGQVDGGWGVWNATKTSTSLSEIQSSGVLGRIRKKCLKQISFWNVSDTCQIDEGSL